jgi:hypothetical protein
MHGWTDRKTSEQIRGWTDGHEDRQRVETQTNRHTEGRLINNNTNGRKDKQT